MKQDFILLLKQELLLLDRARLVLHDSYRSCKKIGIKKEYANSELEKFDAFTSRFARTSDFFFRKFYGSLMRLDRELPGTPRDLIKRAEKKSIIDIAENLIDIRDLRNKIAHEYDPEPIKKIFKGVLKQTPYLPACIDQLKSYCKKYF